MTTQGSPASCYKLPKHEFAALVLPAAALPGSPVGCILLS